MRLSTRLLRQAAGRTVADGFLIPPRTSWDIARSALSASWTLMTSQTHRERFTDILNQSKLIRPDVLGQADLGALMILALFHDLELAKPTLKELQLVPKDFLEGAKPALEEFHEVKSCLENEFASETEEMMMVKRKESMEGKGDEDEEEGKKGKVEADQLKEMQNFAEMAGFGGFMELDPTMMTILKFNWSERAKQEEESLAARLKMMVSDEFFDSIEEGSKTGYLLERSMGKKFMYEESSSKIDNVALLSARTRVMDLDNDYFSSREDDSTSSSDKAEKEEKSDSIKDSADEDTAKQTATKITQPIAAQVEVLYDIQKTFSSSDLPDGKGASGKTDDDADGDVETITKTIVYVGVFEGWLNRQGEELRWKLSNNRPAFEFPDLTPY